MQTVNLFEVRVLYFVGLLKPAQRAVFERTKEVWSERHANLILYYVKISRTQT